VSEQSRVYAEKAVIYTLVLLAAAIWLGFGGAVFVGILRDVAA
jgi:hypothetical protein